MAENGFKHTVGIFRVETGKATAWADCSCGDRLTATASEDDVLRVLSAEAFHHVYSRGWEDAMSQDNPPDAR